MNGTKADDFGLGLGQDALALQPIASAPNHINNNRRMSSPSPPPQPQSHSQLSTPRNDRRRPTLEDRRQPSIRLRRLGSASTLSSQHTTATTDFAQKPSADPSGRRRSSSEPQRPPWVAPSSSNNNSLSVPRGAARPASTHMPRLDEETGRPSTTLPPDVDIEQLAAAGDAGDAVRPGLWKRASVAALQPFRRQQQQQHGDDDPEATPRRRPRRGTWANEYDSDLVDILDVVDPEVATLATLTNVQNSLFIPDLGSLLNRRPTYNLTREPTFFRDHPPPAKAPSVKPPSVMTQPRIETDAEDVEQRPGMDRTFTIASHLSDTEDHYAVLPHGLSLEGWSLAEKQELNDHVRHMLHSRRAAFKRGMKGFGQYVRRPLGLFVTVYATLVTLFGLAWVLFLIGWINVGGRQSYIINIIDNVLVALFAIVGDGLAPFRAVDTYHMIYIAHYHHLTWNLRKKRNLPKLKNENDLPVQPGIDADLEAASTAEAASINETSSALNADAKSTRSMDKRESEESMLTEEQQRKLKHHEDKFSKSHTFYKPHETETHHAFPLRLLVAVVVLLDCHSLLQIALGTCTWAISYHVRPFALTTVILCFSLTCNITGGIIISIGDRITRKKDVVERMFRQQLTEQAIHKMEKRRQKESERNEELDNVVSNEPLDGTGLEPGSNTIQPSTLGVGVDAAELAHKL
ncbi:hypothetical protein D6D17_00505 [Aureobasidium pullulans]|uniref:Integral membrane protein n=1 Tax=Aureobasidium pullulans TaxID=5580 RepID=A0A4S8VTZ7_AURPU|nr:hypothetical protein D6D26_08402 [Aureobasidium pullulans]THW00175.1 hypothetical protein D6D27_00501 [Aureobasidium pullulans]THW15428.1 hypothetical protein D6D24_04965 [Aureobasidium pullulans]THW84005.1 hypothetical protein D6D18_07945 [Aureobasidium pullulans]THW97352.1 hypothetical protein D6D15_00371 [Aureobasidium pullulans]